MELTVRAFAEMITLPPYEQERILHEQKYPRQGATAYRVPYYRPALKSISDYYRGQNNLPVLHAAIQNMPRLAGTNAARVQNNIRVVNSFRNCPQRRRALQPQSISTSRGNIHGVDVRVTPDLVALDAKTLVRIFYNCRATPLDDEVARLTLELTHHILAQSGIVAGFSDSEYIDLHRYHRHRVRRMRSATMRHARSCSRVISGLWPQI